MISLRRRIVPVVHRLQLRVSTEPLQAIMRAPAFALRATVGQGAYAIA
jgi:hypothetical protein